MLYSTLRLEYIHYPTSGIILEFVDQPCLCDIIESLDLNPRDVQMVFINDRMVRGYDYQVKDKDRIKLFPGMPQGG